MEETDRYEARPDLSPFRKREKREFIQAPATSNGQPLLLARQGQVTLYANGALLVLLVALCRSHELR